MKFKKPTLPPMHFERYRDHFMNFPRIQEALFRGVDDEPVFQGASRNFVPKEFLPPHVSFLPPETVELMARMLSHVERFQRCNRRTLVVGERVAKALASTRIDDLDPSLLPSGTFYVALSSSAFRVANVETGVHIARGIYLSIGDFNFTEKLKPSRGVVALVWGEPNATSHKMYNLRYPDGRALGLHRLLSYAFEDIPDMETAFSSPWSTLEFDNPITDTKTALDDLKWVTEYEGDARTLEQPHDVLRVAFNALLYYQSENADLQTVEVHKDERDALKAKLRRLKKGSSNKRAKVERRLASLPRTVVTYIGPKTERQLADAERQRQAQGGDRHGPRLHLVRPHWHRYRVGPGRQKTVIKWIHPFLRGKDDNVTRVTKFRDVKPEEYVATVRGAR